VNVRLLLGRLVKVTSWIDIGPTCLILNSHQPGVSIRFLLLAGSHENELTAYTSRERLPVSTPGSEMKASFESLIGIGGVLLLQACQYFEIEWGAPQPELVLLLHLIHAPEESAAALGRRLDLRDCQGDVGRVAAALGYGSTAGKRRRQSGGRQPPGGEKLTGIMRGPVDKGGEAGAKAGELGGELTEKEPPSSKEELGGSERAVRGPGRAWCPEADPVEDWLLTAEVARSLLRVLHAREAAYQAGTLEEDEALWATLDPRLQPRAHHSLALRIAERRVLNRCRQTLLARLSSKDKW
jgi:hypothetical protein